MDSDSDEGRSLPFRLPNLEGPGGKVGVGCCGCCTLFVLVLSLVSFKGLHATKFALTRNSFTGVVHFDTVYHGGRNFIGAWNSYVEFPATVQSIEWMDTSPHTRTTTRDLTPMQVRTEDGLMVRIGVVAKYFIQKEKLPEIYRTYKMNVEGFFISNLRSQLLATTAHFRATQLYEDRIEVAKALFETCKKVCREDLHDFLGCWRIDLLEVDLDPKIEAANIKEQVEKQKQRTEKMKQNASLIRSGTAVIESDFDRQIQVVQARAKAQAYNLTSQASANATLLTQETRAKALQIIQTTVTDGATTMTREQLLDYLEKLALIESPQGSMVYGNFESASVFLRNEL